MVEVRDMGEIRAFEHKIWRNRAALTYYGKFRPNGFFRLPTDEGAFV